MEVGTAHPGGAPAPQHPAASSQGQGLSQRCLFSPPDPFGTCTELQGPPPSPPKPVHLK